MCIRDRHCTARATNSGRSRRTSQRGTTNISFLATSSFLGPPKTLECTIGVICHAASLLSGDKLYTLYPTKNYDRSPISLLLNSGW